MKTFISIFWHEILVVFKKHASPTQLKEWAWLFQYNNWAEKGGGSKGISHGLITL